MAGLLIDSLRSGKAAVDVLTDVLQTLRVRSACYGKIEASAPWGLRVTATAHAKFHVVVDGGAELLIDGDEPLALHTGDLVALPHGDGHTLVDAAESTPHLLEDVLRCKCDKNPGSIALGGAGARTTLVSGRIEFEDHRHNPLLAVLPRVIVLRDEARSRTDWLEPTLRFLSAETASELPGAQTVVSRLTDIVFVHIVRGYLATLPVEASGWLSALNDPQVGAALRFIHANPEQAWTVQSLAGAVAMSRSAFASRFTRIVGEPPLQYVTRWRMQKAAGLLRDGQATLSEIASHVGYDSEAAFSKAFKREVGSAPGVYRRARREGPSFAA
jgi:AraC-like DNA-binding protein